MWCRYSLLSVHQLDPSCIIIFIVVVIFIFEKTSSSFNVFNGHYIRLNFGMIWFSWEYCTFLGLLPHTMLTEPGNAVFILIRVCEFVYIFVMHWTSGIIVKIYKTLYALILHYIFLKKLSQVYFMWLVFPFYLEQLYFKWFLFGIAIPVRIIVAHIPQPLFNSFDEK